MTTELIRSLYNIKPKHQGGVITIGNYDGVHVGHQKLIKEAVTKACAMNAPSLVVTFEPHPFEFFESQEKRIPRITRLREKVYFLSQCGVDYILILPFNHQLAKTSAREFVTSILYEKLKINEVIVGNDFHFGYQREGDIHLLETLGKQFHFTVETVEMVSIGNERVSSTRIRKALAEGDHSLVKAMLGHPYTMLGRVRGGDQLGRLLGFPTANIYLHRKLTPIQGVYTVYVHGVGEDPWPGVANIGTRPTVDGTRSLLEVHLLNFQENIYGRDVRVEFCEKLRDEVRFSNLDELKEHIRKDVLSARHYFKEHGVNYE